MKHGIFARGLKSHASIRVLALAALGLPLMAGAASAGTLPGHGHFVAGNGAISKSGGVLTIDQSSRTGIVNWKTFSIGKANRVEFDNRNGATLNRVTGGNISRIAGALHGTGSVYIVNNTGVAVLPTGRIVTQGSFAASGGGGDADAFGARKRLLFTGGEKGNVVNEGRIVSNTGRVDLYGHNVSVGGVITAAKGAETSGAHVDIGHARVNANWLIDPKNLTVTTAAANTISNSLDNHHNVTLKTTATSASGPGTVSNGVGNIIINAPVTWSSAARLTLNAYHGVTVNKAITVKGKGGLTIADHNGGYLSFGGAASVTFDDLHSGLTIDGNAYHLVGNLTQLVNYVTPHPAGYVALAHDYDATPLGTLGHSVVNSTFTGTFEGLGNTISNLKIVSHAPDAALFSQLGNGTTGSVLDVTLANVSVTDLADGAYVGGVAGFANNSSGAIRGVHVGGKILGGADSYEGGIVGYDYGPISYSSSSAAVNGRHEAYVGGAVGGAETSTATLSYVKATGDVTDNFYDSEVGGLAGVSYGSIEHSSATGDVSATGYESYTGGLVGYFNGDHVTNSFATGNVAGGTDEYTGGLIGEATAVNIATVHATGKVTAGSDEDVGGLIGYLDVTTLKNAYATGSVTSGPESDVGGLVGYVDEGDISKSHATGAVKTGGDGDAGGLVGYDDGANVATSYAKGNVTAGNFTDAGGLIGYSDYGITDSYATGNVNAAGGDETYAGGLAGYVSDDVSGSYATGNVRNAGYESYTGGLIGYAYGHVTASHATGNVVSAPGYEAEVGGLLGYAEYGASHSYALGNVTGGGDDDEYIGGLIGYSDDDVLSSYAKGNVSGRSSDDDSYIGGLIGYQVSGYDVKSSHASGRVTDKGYEDEVGGLIGYNGSDISNSYASGVINAVASTYSYAGGLVGYSSGAITKSHATGKIYSGYDGYAGGLAGDTSGTVSASYATGDIQLIALDYGTYAGGLIGESSSGAISKSYAKGDITGADGADIYAGGLVGYGNGAITQSYATGNIHVGQGSYAGGLVGYEVAGNITAAYARGNVAAGDASYIGGLLGELSSSVTLDQGYSTGKVTGVTGTGYIGGLVGYDSSTSNITNSYFDTRTSGYDKHHGVGSLLDQSGVTGVTTATLKAQPSGLSTTYFAKSASRNDGFPYLKAVGGQ